MTLRNIYFAYMALVGIVCGAVLVLAPQAAEAFVPPYFWVLIAVGLFDLGLFLLLRVAPAQADGLVNLSDLVMAYMAARFGVLGVYVSGRSREKQAAATGAVAPSVIGQVIKAVVKRK